MCRGVWFSMLKAVCVGSSESGYCCSACMTLIEGGANSAVMLADRVQGFRVLDEEARRGGVDDVVWGGFGEDMVGYGVVKEAPDEGLGKGCFLGEVGEGDGRILRDIGSEVVGVDGAE